ncbi:MAG: TetM/TetW/TetO/TetS family tetracycline resistance ribosomal protection protein [Clostridia bacterium]|nr:TetM/TetW/TetO/TetS family tetracycline resistance ribosomal protection protein [Clostridia bacterium]
MRRTVIGMLAHVDAGKTTLSEAMLYLTGAIRKVGRVDHGNAFLDNFALERARGITIFSKQAPLVINDLHATLLDTPGHVDFSAETERTLDVLDCAVLLISAPEGVQSHTLTLWRLLRKRSIPTFIFVNKTDISERTRDDILSELSKSMDGAFFDYENPDFESIAMSGEAMLDEYLATGEIKRETIKEAVAKAAVFPCCFGAALKLTGVDTLLSAIDEYAPECEKKTDFGARVYKISRDERGARVTHMKITGGTLKVRDVIKYEGLEEKATQIRVYSGAKFTTADEAEAGEAVSVLGLTATFPGLGLGSEKGSEASVLEPVLTYAIKLPPDVNIHEAAGRLMQLSEEDPKLGLVWDEMRGELRAQIMGQVQLEILREVIRERFAMDVTFGAGRIIYRETIAAPVEGVGHFEPLRHYAEVHLILSPLPQGSGLVFDSSCPEDALDRNWQRLILTHLSEKRHRGVLTGSYITDMKITLAAGRASVKHTEGGDFREATYRAVRHGLMRAESVLLEPWYDFRLELPRASLGRALSDLELMGAKVASTDVSDDSAVVTGQAAVSKIGEYPTELVSYTHGLGRIFLTFGAYKPCVEQDRAVSESGYDPEADVYNTADSVFCEGGTSFIVKWNEVEKYMHLESALGVKKEDKPIEARTYTKRDFSDDELMAVFENVYGPVKTDRYLAMKPRERPSAQDQKYVSPKKKAGPEYLLVDGYNIIFAWDELRRISERSMDAARETLIRIMQNYAAYKQADVILVFDAYKVKGGQERVIRMGRVSVVYTKEAQTADQYIERTAGELSKHHDVRVATSDGLEQLIILGRGALRIPASQFEAEVSGVLFNMREHLKDSKGEWLKIKDLFEKE